MIKNLSSVVLIVALAAFAVGCGATISGNKILAQETATSLDQFFVKGKTTQEEVVAKFGKPETTSLLDGKQVWAYTYSKTARASSGILAYAPVALPVPATTVGAVVPSKTDFTTKILQITFSRKGVVERFDFTDSNDSYVDVGI